MRDPPVKLGTVIKLPPAVRAAQSFAAEAAFEYSCDEQVGALLSVMAAAVGRHGRILELGTGAGVGTAWLVHGLGDRDDVEVVTVDVDLAVSAVARRQAWPPYVQFVVAGAVQVLPTLGQFDLVFADAQGGKWERLDLSIDALRPGGTLVVDDMTPQSWWTKDQKTQQEAVRQNLLSDSTLVSCDLAWASGVILSTRRA